MVVDQALLSPGFFPREAEVAEHLLPGVHQLNSLPPAPKLHFEEIIDKSPHVIQMSHNKFQ